MSFIAFVAAYLESHNVNPDLLDISLYNNRARIVAWKYSLEDLPDGQEVLRNFKRAAGGTLTVQGSYSSKWLGATVEFDENEYRLEFVYHGAVVCEKIRDKITETDLGDLDRKIIEEEIANLTDQLASGVKVTKEAVYDCKVEPIKEKS